MFTYWLLQNASVSPDGKLLAVLGDSPEGLIAEANTGKVASLIYRYFLVVTLSLMLFRLDSDFI
jgi:hypothetical protein